MTKIFWDGWPYFVFIALLSLAFLPVRLYIRFYREANEIKVNSQLTFWRIPFCFNIVNPITKVFWRMSVNRPWKSTAPQELKAQDISWFRFFKRLNSIQKIGRYIWKGTNRFFKRVGRPIKIKELNLYTEVGLADAVQTALSTGVLWTIQGILYTRLAGIFCVQQARNNFNVVPNFQRGNFLLVDYSCIFEFRLGHIIIVMYEMFRYTGEIYSFIRRVSK